MACNERWIDVFVTRSDRDASRTGITAAGGRVEYYNFDDTFACTVQSVRLDPDDPTLAVIVSDRASDWIMPTWSTDYDVSTALPNPYANIRAGDLIRFGNTSTTGYTDYITVLEVRHIDKIINGTVYDSLPIAKNGSTTLLTQENPRVDGETFELTIGSYSELTKAGFAHIALRLNATLESTTLPRGTRKTTHSTTTADAEDDHLATLKTRHLAKVVYGKGDECYFYPLYVMNPWTANTLRAKLDHGVKAVDCIKLMGYAVSQKRQVGVHHGHEMSNDDYVILRINEIEGHLISNNSHANGAFACLYTGSAHDNIVGAVEYSHFNTTSGIVTQQLPPNTTFRNLTIDVLDRFGKAAHVGRLHLWFRLKVTHG